MKFHPKVIQIIGDAVIPLLGYFYWNWNLYFIILFYFLDLIVKEVLIHLKTKKTIEFQIEFHPSDDINFNWVGNGLISAVLIGIVFYLATFSMSILNPHFSPIREIMKFWSYKDMGIEQGYILVPLLILAGYLNYKNEFIRLRSFEKNQLSVMWKNHLINLAVLVGFTALLFALIVVSPIGELALILLIVGGSSLYQYLQIRKATQSQPS